MKERTDETVVGQTRVPKLDTKDMEGRTIRHYVDIRWCELDMPFRDYVEGIERLVDCGSDEKQCGLDGATSCRKHYGRSMLLWSEKCAEMAEELADQRRLVWAWANGWVFKVPSVSHAIGVPVHVDWGWQLRIPGGPLLPTGEHAGTRIYDLNEGPLPVLTDEARKAIDEAMEN